MSFHGSVAGAAAASAAHGSRHADETGASDKPPPPHFLSLHPRVALLPPPAQQQPQPQPQRTPGARLLLLTLDLWFPSPRGVGADGASGSGAAVEVLLRHRQRYLPVAVRRLQLGSGPGARKGVMRSAAMAAAAAAGPAPTGHDEGWVERYEVDVRLGGGDSSDALVEPGLLQVDVRWAGLPYMSLPVLLLPSTDADREAAPAAALGTMAAVAEELQRFCRWFGRRGEAAVTLRAAAAAAVVQASGGGAASDQEDQEEEEDVYEDEAGGMLHDLGFVLYGDGDASPGDGSSSAATGAPLGGSSSPLQRCCVQLLLGRGLQLYADGNAMPHVAGLVSHHLARLQEQLVALGGGGFSSLGVISIDGHNCPAMAHCGGEAHEPTSSGSDAARVAVAAAATAATSVAATAERGSDATSAASSRADAGASSAACGSSDCASGVKARAACGSLDGAATTARHQRRVPPAAVAAAAWRSLLLFVGLARQPEEAAAFREACAAWNLRNAPLIEVIEVLMGVSVIARYRANVMDAGATVSFTGTVAFIGFLRCSAAFVVFTAPLLLAAWVVQPLLLALCGVPRERRAQASRRLQQLRQWVRAGPAIGLRLSAVVVSKALLLALGASPPALWLSYSAGLGLVAAEGLLLPVACVLPPLPALLLSALRMPFFAAYMASPHSGAWMPNSGAGSGVDNSSCSVTGALHTWGDASCPAGGGEAGASWARTAYAVWLAVRLEAVALAATWACHVCLRLHPASRAARRHLPAAP
ncbi:hypothetical protein HXX76_012353 [Chlamydomonas incerta]|uniref:Uncharacterized protein n=1 Tax=Chlamydomonas incerta TaxID=51695 RepID=A0A835SHR0_CHLIN|nr:hypothetical protein HXX76_012353 [Chlamydomonas incerta]|eukprot:KAG2427417.1 hypothetical protein HXX76_012353 [Chlamydomonas incerta]